MAESLMEKRMGGQKHTCVGIGYDIHKLVAGRDLWLGGIKISHSKGLLGHSDGDVVLHAVGDAILGALGEGEIGMMFPPDNPKIKGIASKEIIAAVMEKVAQKKVQVSHVDINILAEEPKLKPHYLAIKDSVASILGLTKEAVNIKAKTHEGLDSIGEGKAIACQAVASVLISVS